MTTAVTTTATPIDALKASYKTRDSHEHIDIICTDVQELARAVGNVSTKYLDLCLHIRDKAMAPKLVSKTLAALGFKRSRISEIKRVAFASDTAWKPYEARLIGFDKALELSRDEGDHRTETPIAETIGEAGGPKPEDLDPEDHPKRKKLSGAKKLVKAATTLGKLCRKQSAKHPLTWEVDGGTITWQPKG